MEENVTEQSSGVSRLKRIFVRLRLLFVLDREHRRQMRRRLLEGPGDIHGKGNVVVGKPAECRVMIYGNGNRVTFESPVSHFGGTLHVGSDDCPVSNCEVTIGANAFAINATAWILEDGGRLSIGEGSILSSSVQLWVTDAHSILDAKGHLLNGGPHSVTIGKRCWIGLNTTFLKGSFVADGAIVGMGAVVTGHHCDRPNCAYGGNPARLLRENVFWDITRPNLFVEGAAPGRFSNRPHEPLKSGESPI